MSTTEALPELPPLPEPAYIGSFESENMFDVKQVHAYAIDYARAALAAAAPSPVAIPEGWKLVLVNEDFGGLMDSLERANRNGYMPDAITEYYEGFDYRDAAPTAPQPERYVSALDPVMQAINGVRICPETDVQCGRTPCAECPRAAQPEAPAEPSELVIDGYRGEKGIRWYVAELHRVRFLNHWLADAYCNALQDVYEKDLRGFGKDKEEARRLASNKIADVANACKERHAHHWKTSGQDDAIAALKALATPAPAAPLPADLLKLLQAAEVLFACRCTDSTALSWLEQTQAAIRAQGGSQ